MKKSILLMFVVLLLLPAACRARQVPAFRGFPVYPPQAIDSISAAEEGDVELSLALVSRQAMLEQFETIDPRIARVEDTRKITLEFDVAKSYIQRNAALLGWQIKTLDETWGKDSQEMVFVKKKDPSLEVSVVIWTGQISFTYGAITVQPKDKWGYITYRFHEKEK